MELEVNAPASFHADFAAVSARYMLAELGELEDAKAAARRNIDSAVVCFAALAGEKDMLGTCQFCGYEFDIELLGAHGCPNCEGDGL